FVGRMVPEKGAHVIIESAPDVLSEYPDAKFILVGRGGFLDELKRRAAELNVGHKILFTGYVDDETLLQLYKVADVSTAPSLYEPFGIVALEGMGAQVPVVVADSGGLGEIVEHQKSGITVFPGDPKSLAWGLLEVLKNPDEARQLREQAYQRVLDTFNWPMIARQTAEVYHRVMQEAQQGTPILR
ncbi:MAG: glycosyltransferase family 4 protein, partial [Bacteroidota bacterium]